jgi:nucleoside phosphorylase
MKSKVDFAIVTPLEEERRAMLDRLPHPRPVPGASCDPRVYYSASVPVSRDGINGAYEVIVSDLLAMGRVDAAIVVKDIMRRWAPRYVILAGIAGGFGRAGVAIGDVLVADQIVDFEHQKLTQDGPQIRWSVHRVDSSLLVAAKQLRPDHWQPKTGRPEPGQSRRHIGPVCTGDKVVADGSLERFAKSWPRLIGVEMEAGGAASASYQAVPAPGFLMIRGVSDLADVAKDSARTGDWRGYACDVAAAYVAALLRSAPVPLNDFPAGPPRARPDPVLRCPRCGKRALEVHSRSENEFVLACKNCSATALLSREGSRIASFIVPGIIALTGAVVIEEYLHAHLGDIAEAISDFLESLPDLV